MENRTRLEQLLEKKSAFLKEFLRLTVQQKQALQEKETGRFNELLAAKQAVIEQVDLLDVELALVKKRDVRPGTAQPGTASAAGTGQDKVGALERAIQLYLQQIRDLDVEINQLMKKNMAETLQSINELRISRRTQSAYHNQASAAQSYFINKKR